MYKKNICQFVRYAFSHRDSYSLKTFHITSPGPNENRAEVETSIRG